MITAYYVNVGFFCLALPLENAGAKIFVRANLRAAYGAFALSAARKAVNAAGNMQKAVVAFRRRKHGRAHGFAVFELCSAHRAGMRLSADSFGYL